MEEEQKGGPSTTLETPPAPPAAEADELVSIRTKLEESERRRSGLDRELTKFQRERERLLSALASTSNTQGYQSRLDSLELTLAELLDAQGVTGEETTSLTPHKEQLLRKRNEEKETAEREQKLLWEAKVSSAWDDIVDQAESQGKSTEAISQDVQFLALWNQGDLKGAKRRAYAVVANKTPSTQTKPSGAEGEAEETEEQRIERLAEEKTRQTLRARGLLKNEGGGGSVPKGPTTFTEEQISDPMFWKDHKEAILKAQAEGKIKVR